LDILNGGDQVRKKAEQGEKNQRLANFYKVKSTSFGADLYADFLLSNIQKFVLIGSDQFEDTIFPNS